MKSKIQFAILLMALLTSLMSNAQIDTLTNRYADNVDAAYWPSVNVGDYIFFKGNINNGKAIYAGGSVFYVNLPVGKKILIWRGEYRRIYIDGVNCASTTAQPTIITNLGGQVKWGYSELTTSNNRTLELANFEYLHVTGKYDPANQTGDANYLGHDGGKAYNTGNFYERYGMWGNPRWSGPRFNGYYSNIVRIRGSKVVKVDYLAATEGGFAGFNIKTDNPSTPQRVEIDVQDCFAGWTESEGFYISYSTSAAGQDLTKLTFRNNIMAFCGSESLQTDNLTEGSVIENNVAFAGACFFRRPFQDFYQDGLHQFSIVEGGITVRNNIMITGNSLHQIRFKDPGAGRGFPDPTKKVTFKNNYYGFSRSNLAYVWQGDGITKYEIDSCVYGPISTPSTRDAYNTSVEWSSYYKICNNNTEIDFLNTLHPGDRPFYQGICGAAQVDTISMTTGTAPLLEFINSGFPATTDYRKFTFWSAEFETAEKAGISIPYEVDDYVFYYDSIGETRFYKCIQAHAGNFDPNTSPAQWQQLNWNGRRLPPLNLRLVCDSYYHQRAMGLDYETPSISGISVSVPTCNGSTDGSIVVTASGGNSPYQYSSDGITFQNSSLLEGLGAGNYSVIIEDVNGCQATASASVVEPPALTYVENVTDANCGQSDGSIDLSAAGGSSGYQFSIDGGNTFSTSGTFNNLPSGSYAIVVEDANGCQTSGSTAVNNTNGPVISSVQAANTQCAGSADGELIINATGNNLMYSINGGNSQSVNVFDNLPAGSYNILVEDSNGCQSLTNSTINEPLAINTSAIITNEQSGSDGAIDLTVTGGIPGYQFLWSNGSSTEDLSNISAGTYNVSVSDANNCLYDTSFVVQSQVGIEDILIKIVTIYPNPCTNQVTVDADLPIHSIGVLDYMGRRLSQITKSSVVKMEHLPSGIYFLEIEFENGVKIEKVIKQ